MTSAQQGQTLLWNARTGRIERRFPIGGPFAVSPDGRHAGPRPEQRQPRRAERIAGAARSAHRRTARAPAARRLRRLDHLRSSSRRDGASIVGRAVDSAVRVWDGASGLDRADLHRPGVRAERGPRPRRPHGPVHSARTAPWRHGTSPAPSAWAGRSAGGRPRWLVPSTPCFVVNSRRAPHGRGPGRWEGRPASICERGGWSARCRRGTVPPPTRSRSSPTAGRWRPAASTATSRLWDVADPVRCADPAARIPSSGSRSAPRAISWRPDAGQGQLRFAGRGAGPHLGAVLHRHVVRYGRGALYFSPDGRSARRAGMLRARLRHRGVGRPLGQAPAQRRASPAMRRPSRSRRTAVCSRSGREDGKVVLWNAADGSRPERRSRWPTGHRSDLVLAGRPPLRRQLGRPDGDPVGPSRPQAPGEHLPDRTRARSPSRGSRLAGDLLIDNLADAAQWPTGLRTWERFACQVAGRDLSPAEWRDLLPSRPYPPRLPTPGEPPGGERTYRGHEALCAAPSPSPCPSLFATPRPPPRPAP